MPSIAPEAIFCTLVLFIIFIIVLVVVLSLRKKERCPVYGTTWIEKTPKQYNIFGIPSTLRGVRYKFRCRKCQHEWEGYACMQVIKEPVKVCRVGYNRSSYSKEFTIPYTPMVLSNLALPKTS